MKLTIFKLKFWMLSFVLTDFGGFSNCERILHKKHCYDGCTCQTWFGYPACIAAYWFPDLCGCCQGYTMKNCQCVDINECEENTKPCDQICVNTVGSYQCLCKRGYTYNMTRRRCVSAGPCFSESHFCEHICKPLGIYRYRCACYPGFDLASDKISCLPVY